MTEYKAVPLAGYSEVDPSTGVVETIVSVTGVVDNVNDIIEPGAYAKSLEQRLPKGIWSHDWNQPLSRTLDIKELLPGDSELPETLPDGSPWPSEAGALKVKTEFNLKTARGRDAYEDVKFFGRDQEWSIGYNVPVGGANIDTKTGIRHIHSLDLYEYSPVLFGAMPLARTTSVKSAQLAYKSLMETEHTKDDGRGDTRWGEGNSEIPGDDAEVNLTDEQLKALKDALPVLQALVGQADGGSGAGPAVTPPRIGGGGAGNVTNPASMPIKAEPQNDGTAKPDISVPGDATAASLIVDAFPDNDEIATIAQQFDDADNEADTEEAADILLNAIEDTADGLDPAAEEGQAQREALARLAIYIAEATTPTEDSEDAGEEDTSADDTSGEEEESTDEEKVLLDMSEFKDLESLFVK